MFGPVTMMDIPVYDGNPVNGVKGVSSGDRCIVEKTKSHRPVMPGMVAGRPHEGKCVLTVKGEIEGHDRGAGRISGGNKRAMCHIGVGIEPAGDCRRKRPLPEPCSVIRRVNPVYRFVRCRPCDSSGNIRKNTGKYVQEPGVTLGVTRKVVSGTGRADNNAAVSHCSLRRGSYGSDTGLFAGPGLSALCIQRSYPFRHSGGYERRARAEHTVTTSGYITGIRESTRRDGTKDPGCEKHRTGSAGCKYYRKMLPADRTEHLLLAVKFVEGIGSEHDTFPVLAMIEAEKMPDLVGTFLRDPVNQVVIVILPPVIFIAETGSRDDRCTYLLAGKAEDKTVAVPEEILVDNKKDRFRYPVVVFIGLDAVQQRLRIDLFPADHISHHPDVVLVDIGRHAEDRRDHAADRRLETGRGEGIPKNMDMHRYILLEWAPINILRHASGSTSRSTIPARSK